MHPALSRILTRRLVVGVILFCWCVVAATLTKNIAPGTAFIIPSSAFGIGVLFLEGLWLWPAVYLAAVTNTLIGHSPLLYSIVFPIAITLQSLIGAHLLKAAKVDPLFRKRRDSLWLLAIILAVAAITPVTWSAIPSGDTLSWGARYVGIAFYLLIFTPFIMRWFAKPRFVRPVVEIAETLGIFLALIALDGIIFISGVGSVRGLSLVYFLLVPLFWIALRLRPRFVTLAMLITSGIALYGLVHTGIVPDAAVFGNRLFQLQVFIIILDGIFLVITTLEEDRRLNTNLIRSQVAALENAVTRISSESQAKNNFIAVLAHELRNPLAPVTSGIEFLQLAPERPPEEIELLTVMSDRMQTVRRLLEDLLDISRISEGKVTLKKESTSLDEVVRSAILSTEHHFNNRHQPFTAHLSRERLYVNGDPVRLEQVFTNLLTNASKYSDTGDAISLTATREGEYAVIVIRDEGIGLTPESLDKIFVPFHQEDWDVRGKKGLGIGLALVRSFVVAHDGTIRVESAGLGKGSTFTVTLPLIKAPKPEAQKLGIRDRVARFVPARPGIGSRSVLIIDDNDAAAWGIGRLLELRGCSVDYAYNAEQGMKKALANAPAIVILDIGLPDMDGDKAAMALRYNGFKGKIIALTGFTAESRSSLDDDPFDAYLVKPVGLTELQAIIPGIS